MQQFSDSQCNSATTGWSDQRCNDIHIHAEELKIALKSNAQEFHDKILFFRVSHFFSLELKIALNLNAQEFHDRILFFQATWNNSIKVIEEVFSSFSHFRFTQSS